MRVLIDECLPRKIKHLFRHGGHACQTVHDAGLSSKENGELLDWAESRFDVFVTVDRNLRHQQNMTGRKMAVLVIRVASNDLEDILPHIDSALDALRSIQPGQVVEVGLEK